MKWKKLVLNALSKIYLRYSMRVQLKYPRKGKGRYKMATLATRLPLGTNHLTNSVSLSLLQVAGIRINTLNSWQKYCKAIALRYIYTLSSILESLK